VAQACLFEEVQEAVPAAGATGAGVDAEGGQLHAALASGGAPDVPHHRAAQHLTASEACLTDMVTWSAGALQASITAADMGEMHKHVPEWGGEAQQTRQYRTIKTAPSC